MGHVHDRGFQLLVQTGQISARIWTRSLASRFDSGSSKRNAFGSRTMARPSATRCRWPPESCLGFAVEQVLGFRAASSRLADAAAISAFGTSACLRPKRQVLVDGHVRIEGVVLEDHGDVAVARAARR